MQKFYDREKDRILFFKEKASEEFWDSHWKTDNIQKLKEQIQRFKGHKFILDLAKKYLPDKKEKILEGGCGIGGYVYCLNDAGYDAAGIDYASKTVETVKSCFPHLNIEKQDVRKTEYEDSTFAIYFSFGVIEHFFEGYDEIIEEASRIIKPKGYFIVSFPQISLFRRIKIILNLYPENKNPEIEKFYQYALNSKNVELDLLRYGFKIIDKVRYDGIKGFKDEIGLFKNFLQSVYDNKRGILMKSVLDKILKTFSAHMCLLIMQKL